MITGIEKAKRNKMPDYKYNSLRISKFICYVMKNGLKTKSRTIVYKALDLLQKELKCKNVLVKFNEFIEAIICTHELVNLKFGGAVYKCPIISTPFRRLSIAMRKVVKLCRKRVRIEGIKMSTSLFREMRDTLLHKSSSILKAKINMDKLVYANRSFAELYIMIQRNKKKFILENSPHKGF